MKLRVSIVVGFVWLIASSCNEETIHLDLSQAPPHFVIEGVVTDAVGKQYVRITKSTSFYDTATIFITNAAVTITDDLGQQMIFNHNPSGNLASNGYYFPSDSNYVGTIGRTYSLNVFVDNTSFTASDPLIRVTKIDSLKDRINQSEEVKPASPGLFYELLLFLKEPQDTKDYYLVKYYRNGVADQKLSDVYVYDDQGIGENLDGLPSSVMFAQGDQAKVELYSLTESGFKFYQDLKAILSGDGGLRTPQPGNPRTNITGGALGLFRVSAMNQNQTVVK
jgi:hypothetical protein